MVILFIFRYTNAGGRMTDAGGHMIGPGGHMTGAGVQKTDLGGHSDYNYVYRCWW